MDVSEDVTGTLRAEAHHPPCVMESAGFRTEHSAKSRSIGYEEEISPTLCAGVVPATVYENHGQDCRYTGPLNKSQTVSATYGTGGNNQPLVVQKPKTLKIRSGCEGGGKGALIQDDKSATLGTHNDQTLFQPKVYGICSKDSNAMKSANPHSGFYEATTSRTLDGKGGNPSCNQGGMAVIEGNGTRPSHKGDGYKESDVMYTLNATEQHAVAYGIVRRLTPTECARLQGFPDWWCDGLGTENPTEEEIAFWRDVFETHRKVITGAKKPKTDNQIRKWLKSPHSDSAEYKMWGNGIALPCVHFVLAGIVYYSQFESGGKLIAEVKA